MSTTWPLLSRLLDDLLALPHEQRATWLAGLEGEAATLRPRLEALVQRDADAAAQGFLEHPPDFTLPGSADEAEPLHAIGEAIGPWRLTRLLGQGGMAEVWWAERIDGAVARGVALKLPRPGFATGRMAARFARERELLARLTHPGIARLYDAGTTDAGQPWLAMEAVDGSPLVTWCDERQASLSKRIDVILQVCDALQHAHGRLVVHRDIKPSNILVTAEGEVRLLDFGIAKLLQPGSGEPRTSLTHISGRPMTPEYASPEQIRGEEPGIAADVYAVGVLAYRLFAGVGPYEPGNTSAVALEAAILDQEPRSPSARVADRKLGRELRGDLDMIILRALKKAPEDRYPTIDAFAADLRRHLSGLPVIARPSSWGYRASRYLRRNRWTVAGATVVLCSLLAGTAVALLQAQSARAEAAQSQAMYKFVLDLFNPGGRTSVDGRIRDRKMSEVIAEAAQRAGTALADVPQAREELLTQLTELTSGLGLTEATEGLLQQRLILLRRMYGDESDQVLTATAESVLTLFNTGHAKEGFALAESLLATCERRHCTDATRARLLAAAGEVGAEVHAGPWPLERQRLAQALVLSEKAGAQLSFLAHGMDTLVALELDVGALDAAASHARRAVDIARAAYGEDGWVTARSKQALAEVERQLGRPAQATRLLRESLASLILQWGMDSTDTLRARMTLAELLFPSRFRAEAMEQLQAAAAQLLSDKNIEQRMLRDEAREGLLTLDVRRGGVASSLQACEQAVSADADKRSQLRVLRYCAELAGASNSPRASEWTLALSSTVKNDFGDIPKIRLYRLLADAEFATLQGRHDDAARSLTEAGAVLRPHRPDITARWNFDRAVNVIATGAMRNDVSAVTSRNVALAEVQATIDSIPEKEDADYFEEPRALLLEARGRLRLAAGSIAQATDDLRASLAVRESIDDSHGIWLRRNLQALAQALQAQGDVHGLQAVRERLARIEAAARPAVATRTAQR